jgi:predicted aspartyl protease
MDFRNKTFTVADSHYREPIERDTIVVTAKSRFGQLVLVDSDIDGLPITVIVDSGAQNTIGNLALRRLLAKRQKGMEFYKTRLVDVAGGTLEADLSLVDNIRIGGFTVNTVVVAFADAHPFKRFDLLNRPAMLLGMDTLKVFRRVSVDFAQRKIRFLLPGEV